jgi:ankyrin repeat protein
MKYASVADVLARVQLVVEFGGIELKGPNQYGLFRNTPLAVVITWGDVDAARLLLEAGADPNARLEIDETALHRAASFDQLEIAQLLLEKGADPNVRDRDGLTPLDWAKIGNSQAVINLLANLPT